LFSQYHQCVLLVRFTPGMSGSCSPVLLRSWLPALTSWHLFLWFHVSIPVLMAGRGSPPQGTKQINSSQKFGHLDTDELLTQNSPPSSKLQELYTRLHTHIKAPSSLLGLVAKSSFIPIPGFGIGNMLKGALSVAMACACVVILLKFCGKCKCSGKRCDVRTWSRCISKVMLYIGCDEFAKFDVIITVHSVQDVVKSGMLGKKEFSVKIAFNWSSWRTTPTRDLRWEQTKGILVPQGATECKIVLYSSVKGFEGKEGELTLETKEGMLDRDCFWGQRQKLKLETSAGKLVGTLHVTFRKKGGPQAGAEGGGDGDGDGNGGGGGTGGGALVPIAGIAEDSALYVELMKAMEELEATPGYTKPEGLLEGDQKISLLGQTVSGPLREVIKGKEQGQIYAIVVHCNVAEISGDKMAEERKKTKRKSC